MIFCEMDIPRIHITRNYAPTQRVDAVHSQFMAAIWPLCHFKKVDPIEAKITGMEDKLCCKVTLLN
jgi:hypothetical protein